MNTPPDPVMRTGTEHFARLDDPRVSLAARCMRCSAESCYNGSCYNMCMSDLHARIEALKSRVYEITVYL